MSYLVLARKWRPRTFDQLVGQDHVRRALTNALDSGRIHHAFLFTGTRGVGKTTIARIFAKSLNCETGISSTPCGKCSTCVDIDAGRFVDLLEVDAASRTKVDDTRELLDNVQYSPARGRYKVYLIDEVHMLSTHSFNALLKTLEEPPPHVKFLLATTDPQKLPVTVLSRCLQFHLRRLPLPLIYDRLAQISTAEEVEFEPAALRAIARGAEGSMRDALSLLDQVLAFGGGRAMEAEVRTLLGTLDRKHVQGILTALAEKDGAALMRQAAHLDERAPDYHQALGELSGAIQRMALLQALPDLPPGDDEDEDKLLAELAAQVHGRRPAVAVPDCDQLAPRPRLRAGRARGFRNGVAAHARVPSAGLAAGCGDGRWRGGHGAGDSGRTTRECTVTPCSRGQSCAAAVSPPAAESDWDALVAALGLQGTAKHFAANCVMLERKPGLVRLRLDPAGDSFRRPQIESRLAEALSQHYGETIRLEITQAEAPGEILTPAKRDAIATEDRQRAAEQSIDSDPAVRAMREVFGATVRPGSVKPLN